MKLKDFLNVLNAYDYYLYDGDKNIIYDLYDNVKYEQFLNDFKNNNRNPHLNRIIKEVVFRNNGVYIYLQ